MGLGGYWYTGTLVTRRTRRLRRRSRRRYTRRRRSVPAPKEQPPDRSPRFDDELKTKNQIATNERNCPSIRYSPCLHRRWMLAVGRNLAARPPLVPSALAAQLPAKRFVRRGTSSNFERQRERERGEKRREKKRKQKERKK